MQPRGRPAEVLHLARDDVGAAGPFDVCVVGAGPVGQSCAQALCEKGLRVLLVESGGATPSTAVNKQYPVEVVGDDRYGDLTWKAWRALGGTAWAWGIDVAGRSRGVRYSGLEAAVVDRSVADLPQWPLSSRQVEDLDSRALVMLGLDAMPSHRDSLTADAVPGLLEASYIFGPAHRFTDTPRAEGQLVLVVDATVTQLVPEGVDSRRIAGVVVRSRSGRSLCLDVPAVVLAANAVENARLALALRARWPALQSNNRIGVGLMDRPRVTGVLTLSGDPPEHFSQFAARVHGSLVSMRRWSTARDDVARGLSSCAFILAPDLSATPVRARWERAVKWVMIDFSARHQATLSDVLGGRVGRTVLNTGRQTYAWRSRRYRRVLSGSFNLEWADWSARPWRSCRRWLVTASVEQHPDPSNRVELSRSVDDQGEHLARVVWGHPAARAQFLPSLSAASDAVQAAGLGRLVWPGDDFDTVSSHHLMGTLAFGRDPRTSAADPEGRIHGTENLFAAGASLFPTSGAANPTLSAIGLALHVADSIAAQLGERATTSRPVEVPAD